MDVIERLTRDDWSQRLELLGLEPRDRAPIEQLIAHVLADPAQVAVVQRYADDLLLPHIGAWQGVWDREGFPDADKNHPVMAGALPLCAILATADDVHAHHLARGIDAATSWASLADIGQQVTKHRLVRGTTGVSAYNWLRNIWAGAYLRLGRLQFELYRTDFEGVLGSPITVLNTHIPAGGAMRPDLVSESLGRAAGFFTHHFADQLDHDLEWIICSSWLLDPQLLLLLPGSNIADFCARWQVVNVHRNDRDGYYFVFNDEPDQAQELPYRLDDLPQRNSLERALVGLWRRGGHVYQARGRLAVSTLAGGGAGVSRVEPHKSTPGGPP